MKLGSINNLANLYCPFYLVEEDIVIRQVDEGPPVKVVYLLSEHGNLCGRLLSPLVAHLKIHHGSVRTK